MGAHIGDDTKQSFHEFLVALKRDRERLQVQLNLGKKELRDEWDVVEQKWGVLEGHLAEFSDEAKDAAHRVGNEISEVYHRLKDRD